MIGLNNIFIKNAMEFVGFLANAGLVLGVIGGLRCWKNWLVNEYKWVYFSNPKLKSLEPTVNTALVCGQFITNVVYCGATSCITAVTFPISVPLLLKYCEKYQE